MEEAAATPTSPAPADGDKADAAAEGTPAARPPALGDDAPTDDPPYMAFKTAIDDADGEGDGDGSDELDRVDYDAREEQGEGAVLSYRIDDSRCAPSRTGRTTSRACGTVTGTATFVQRLRYSTAEPEELEGSFEITCAGDG